MLAFAAQACLDSEFVRLDTVASGGGDLGAETGQQGDGGAVDDAMADGGVDGGADAADAQTASCPGAAQCACADHSDCASGLCQETATGKACAGFCVEGNCGPGLVCGAATVQNAAGQPVTKNGVCLPRWARECMPCTADEVCPIAADPGAACVSIAGNGDDGRYCAPTCKQDADCPPNRACQARTSVGGIVANHCVPKSAGCPCSPLATALGAKTICANSVLGAGSCKGERACGPDGLSLCSAATPTAEACNGLDDDCDLAVDEPAGATAICDDGKPCTADTCSGKDGCAHLPVSVTCSDGDACTGPDGCAAGECAGPKVPCDDTNPCTTDACDTAEGCTHTVLGPVSCNDGDACTTGETCAGGNCTAGATLPCGDDNPCTADLCEAQKGCVFLATDATCNDDNACTGVDVCKAGKCQGPALLCDDGWGCTTDACDPGNGCTFKPGSPGCGFAKVPYGIEFACGDAGFVDWKVTAAGIGMDSPQPPLVKWQVDDTPALGGAAQCGLNVNNGKDLACGFGQKALLQTADSPWIDATAIAPGAPLKLRFESAGLWSSTQTARVLIKGQVGTFVELAKLPPSGAVWGKVPLDIATWVGKTFMVRLEFAGGDCNASDGVGWFVRKFEVVVDPCAVNNGGCASQAVCSASPSGLPQCACKPGFSGNGKVCSDINECENGTAKCAAGATCTNLQGTYSCGCKNGYTGDGVVCSDIDECKAAASPCSADATCANTDGSYTCACKAGYSGDGKSCKDIDECATGNGGCAATATCTNTPGSSSCACKSGYSGDGKACADIDECKTGNGGCATEATCANSAGSFTCACKPGFVGDGKSCLLYGGPQAPASSCKAIKQQNTAAASGTYHLALAGTLVQVQCDMTTDGGGWTVVAYKADFAVNAYPKSTSTFLTLPADFQTVLSAAQIKALQAVSTEGRQSYVGLCNKMTHYYYAPGVTYNYAMGFKFANGGESGQGQQVYTGATITVPQDGCKNYAFENATEANATIFQIVSPKVPVVNLRYKMPTTQSATKFGSPLTKYPAMLR
ncbi:MAG: hypothetical protein FJ100_12115 [Deltaproteobacteria bacterium]|nr:hypothetical protein [Deltaproteobacteria bacterium]